MKKITLLLFLISGIAKSQVGNPEFLVGSNKIMDLQPIVISDTLYGYCMLSFYDKVSETENKFVFKFYDLDLKETRSVDYLAPNRANILSYNFNGTVLCFLQQVIGQDKQIGNYEPPIENTLVFIDSINEVTKVVTKINDKEINLSGSVIPIKNKGFIFSKGALLTIGAIDAFDNMGNILWSKDSLQLHKVLGANISIISIKAKVGKKLPNHLASTTEVKLLNFTKGGKEIYSQILTSEPDYCHKLIDILLYENNYYFLKKEMRIIQFRKNYAGPDVYSNPQKYIIQKVSLIGEEKNSITIDGTLGESFSTNTKKWYNLQVPTEKFVLNKAYFENGKFYLTGDRFFEDESYELWIAEFDAEFKMSKIHKRKTNHRFPLGFSLFSPFSYYENRTSPLYYSTNHLYYSFYNLFIPNIYGNNPIYYTYETKNSNGYINLSFTLDALKIDDKGSLLHSMLVFKDLSTNFLFPAKPGYVCIFEYFEKEKKIDFRLEKFDF